MADTNKVSEQLAVFSDVSPALPALITQYANHTAPHALMISGQFGFGKTTLASLLAQALMCEGENKPCGACRQCVRVQNRSHANMLVVGLQDKQRSVKVEQARDLLSDLAAYPFSAGPRLVLLELVDMFTPQAQNALLKAIEEPEPSTYFLLTCVNERAVLTTIRSRCQLLRLPAWTDEQVERTLIQQGLPLQESKNLASLALGSPGKALQIQDDKAFWAIKRLVDEVLTPGLTLQDFPEASKRFKDQKDNAGLILDTIEFSATHLASTNARNHDTMSFARRLYEGVVEARRLQASNVSWQAIIDALLLSTIEE